MSFVFPPPIFGEKRRPCLPFGPKQNAFERKRFLCLKIVQNFLDNFLNKGFCSCFCPRWTLHDEKACVRGTENDAGYTEQLFPLARWQPSETTCQGSTDKPSSKKHWDLHSKIHYQTACHHQIRAPSAASEKCCQPQPFYFFCVQAEIGLTLGGCFQPMWSMRHPPAESINVTSVTLPLDAEGIQSWDPGLKVTYGQPVAAAHPAAVFGESESRFLGMFGMFFFGEMIEVTLLNAFFCFCCCNFTLVSNWKCDRSSPTILAKSSLRGDQYLRVYIRSQAFSDGKGWLLGAGELWKVLVTTWANKLASKGAERDRTRKTQLHCIMKWWCMFWGQNSILYPLATA